MSDDLGSLFISSRERDPEKEKALQELYQARQRDKFDELQSPMEPPLEPPAEKMKPEDVRPDEKDLMTISTGNVGINLHPVMQWIKNIPGDIGVGLDEAGRNTADLIGIYDEVEAADKWLKNNIPMFGDFLKNGDELVRKYKDEGTEADKVTQTMAQFFIPFSGWLKGVNAVAKPTTILGKGVSALGADAITTFHAFPPEMDRFSEILAEKGVENQFIDYMASHEGSDIEERFKNSLEAVGFGGTVGPLVYGASRIFKTLSSETGRAGLREKLTQAAQTAREVPGRLQSAAEGAKSGYARNPIAEPQRETFKGIPAFESSNKLREREFAQVANELKLTEEQTARLRELPFMRSTVLDDLTGYMARHDREPSMERAIKYIKDYDTPGQYVGMDVVNLGGLNKALTEPGADKVFKEFTDIIRAELDKAGGQINLFRHGGDEVSAIVLGVDDQALNEIMIGAKKKALEKAKELGIDTIPHSKAGKKPGTGISFAISGLDPESKVDDVLTRTSDRLEAAKEGIDVNKKLSQTPGPGGFAKQAGGAEGFHPRASTASGNVGRRNAGQSRSPAKKGRNKPRVKKASPGA